MEPSQPIPPFDDDGLLPDGVYDCNEETFARRFVEAFPQSTTRIPQYEGFRRLRNAAGNMVGSATQWINGSYVTSKLNPGDMDLVTFVDHDALNRLSMEQQETVLRLLEGRESTKPTYGCHTFMVPFCGEGHLFFPHFERQRVYWRKWFGKQRDRIGEDGTVAPGRLKGFVQVSLGDLSKAPVVSTERGRP